MYRIHLSSILVYLCINITHISFHQFFQRILLNMFKHIITQQEMPKITVSIKQRKCSLIVQLEIADLLFGILWIKLSSIVKLPNTSEISWNLFYYLNTIDFILRHVLCICWIVCKVYFCKSLIFFLLKPLLGHDLSQAFMAFWSCPQYHVVFLCFCFDVWY